MSPRVAQRPEHVKVLRDRAGPAVAEDQRHGAWLRRTDVQKVHVGTIDSRCELRVLVEPGLQGTPVVTVQPVLRQVLDGTEGNAVAVGATAWLVSPAGSCQPVAQVRQLAAGYLYPERQQAPCGGTGGCGVGRACHGRSFPRRAVRRLAGTRSGRLISEVGPARSVSTRCRWSFLSSDLCYEGTPVASIRKGSG
jgi:hypothetical protein